MSSGTGDKLKSAGNALQGQAKETVGEATGNESMQAEGDRDRVKGKGQEAVGNVKDAADTLGEKVGGAADKLRGKS